MNHGLAQPAVHWSAGSILGAQDSGMCPTCEVMPDFLSSPGSYAPSPAGTAVREIARKIS
jgi:hypothetical protein